MWELFAQTDPITGGAGWASAGALGLVVGYLLVKYLPARDQQIHDLITEKDAQLDRLLKRDSDERERDRVMRHELASTFQTAIVDQAKQHVLALEDQRKDFREALLELNRSTEKRTVAIVAALHEELNRVKSADEPGV